MQNVRFTTGPRRTTAKREHAHDFDVRCIHRCVAFVCTCIFSYSLFTKHGYTRKMLILISLSPYVITHNGKNLKQEHAYFLLTVERLRPVFFHKNITPPGAKMKPFTSLAKSPRHDFFLIMRSTLIFIIYIHPSLPISVVPGLHAGRLREWENAAVRKLDPPLS